MRLEWQDSYSSCIKGILNNPKAFYHSKNKIAALDSETLLLHSVHAAVAMHHFVVLCFLGNQKPQLVLEATDMLS